MTRTNYTPLSPIEDDTFSPDNISPLDSADNSSILSNAAPQSGHQAYRPPPSQRLPAFNIQYSRIPTPPVHHPISWPGIFPSRTPSAKTLPPSRTQSSRTQPPSRTPSSRTHPYPPATSQPQSPTRLAPSPSFHSQLSRPYDEPLPWAQNATHFRAASSSSQEPEGLRGADVEAGICYDQNHRPSKQYFRPARHVRRPWNTGFVRRFPWRGGIALGVLGLLTPSSIAILFAAKVTSPTAWKAIQPSTCLSIIEVFATLLTIYALFEGVTVYFWTNLIRGSTLAEVHDSAAPLASIRNLRLRRKSTWASLFAIVSLARGPLFQSAIIQPSDNASAYGLSTPPLVIGTLLSYASIVAIIPLYANFLLLGRSVSLHPLEIARAFGSPLFDGLDGNVGARDIELERGHVRVRYGAVEKNGEEKILRVAEGGREIREGEIFG